MYEHFYGLQENPFSMTPDIEYFYRYSGHQEALNVLLVALRNGEGFVSLTGEVGTGKTLLCRQLLQLLQQDFATVYIPYPQLTPLELYQAIAADLQIDLAPNATIQQIYQKVFTELIRLKNLKRPLVVLIDEAQAMPYRSLEAVRLLSNLETDKEKLLHIVFFGQPEFDERLTQTNLRQLRQRITFSYRLQALDSSEVPPYLNHRLRIAGFQGQGLFGDAAARLIHQASNGVPRIINLLAHKALLSGYGKGIRQIGRKQVVAAIKDTDGVTVPGTRFMQRYLMQFGLILVVAIATMVALEAIG
jgi:MSHA biogenesis protein MshM